jgi:hypothetical protein
VIKRFELSRSLYWTTVIAPWFFIVLAALSTAVPFLESDVGTAEILLAVVLVTFFGSLAAYGFIEIRGLVRQQIGTDEAGVWFSTREHRDQFASWHEIVGVRERLLGQRIELELSGDRAPIRAEYQLQDFSALRRVIAEKVVMKLPSPDAPLSLRQTWKYRAFQLTGVALYLSLCLLLLSWGRYVIATIGLAVCWMQARRYLSSVTGVSLRNGRLEIERPFQVEEIATKDVVAIEFGDRAQGAFRIPQVRVIRVDSEQPIVLERLQWNSIALFQLLSRWHRNAA